MSYVTQERVEKTYVTINPPTDQILYLHKSWNFKSR